MLELFAKSDEEKKEFLTNFKDPFKSQNIEEIWLIYRKPLFSDDFIWEATIHFRSGDTKGEHKIKNSHFPTLIKQVEEFIKSKN